MRLFWGLVGSALAALIAASCGDSVNVTTKCKPGLAKACQCENGAFGETLCGADERYGTCACGSGGAAGSPSGEAGAESGGSGGDAGAEPTARLGPLTAGQGAPRRNRRGSCSPRVKAP
jgi:hypothetical protein